MVYALFMVYALSDGSELACRMILPDIPAQAARMTGIYGKWPQAGFKNRKGFMPRYVGMSMIVKHNNTA